MNAFYPAGSDRTKRAIHPRVEALEERRVPTGGPPPPGFLFTPVTTTLAMHIHPHLTIIMDGQNVPIPAGIGISPQGYLPIHTHDSSGTIHVESPVLYDFTLQNFFTIWGQPFSSQQLLGFHADAAHPITMYVNNVPSTAFGSLVLQDQSNILLVAGGPGDANSRFVAQVYQDLLHRPADPGSQGIFTFLLDAGQMSRSQVVATLEASTEYRAAETQGLYHQLLGRDANAPEMAADSAFLGAGGTKEQLEAMLLGSQEYFQKRGGNTAAGFLAALYHDVLGRTIDSGSVSAWEQALNHGLSATGVASAILASTEAESLVVQDLFQQLLHRPADPGAVTGFARALQQGLSQDGLTDLLLGSDEYFSHV